MSKSLVEHSKSWEQGYRQGRADAYRELAPLYTEGVDDIVSAIKSRLLHFAPTYIEDVEYIAEKLKEKYDKRRITRKDMSY